MAIKEWLLPPMILVGLVAWLLLGLVVLALSPILICMVAAGAYLFEPDLDGY